MKKYGYIVINPGTKTILKMNDICLDQETKDFWFDVCSNSFNTLMYLNKNDANFYIDEKSLKEINETDLLNEAQRIYMLLSLDYIRTIRPSRVNDRACIYRCIFVRAIEEKIYVFDKDQTLFVLYKSYLKKDDKKEKQVLYVITQPYQYIDVDNIQVFDFEDIKQKYDISENDEIDQLAKKLLFSYQNNYPMAVDVFFREIKPIFKGSTYPLPFDEKILSKSKKIFNPTYIYQD